MLAGERDVYASTRIYPSLSHARRRKKYSIRVCIRVWHFARNGKEDRSKSKKEKEIGNNEYFFLEECNMARNNFLLLERRREREKERKRQRELDGGAGT